MLESLTNANFQVLIQSQYELRRATKKSLIKNDSCFRLDNLEDIQKAFNQITNQVQQQNDVLGELSQQYNMRESQFKQKDYYKTPSNNQQNQYYESSDEDDLSQIVEYNEVKEPKEKPKKILNLVLKNGQLIKLGEETINNENKQLTSKDLQLLQQYAKRKVSLHTKGSQSNFKRSSEVSRKTRCFSQANTNNLQQFNAQDCNQMNSLVESYGESLIVHNMRDSQSQQQDSSFFSSVSSTTKNLSSELVKEFGISTTALRSFDSFEEKRQYIIEQMNETLQKLLANFKFKMNERDKSYQNQEENIYKSNGFYQRNDPHYLDWLMVQSQYEGIKVKLKEMIVVQMNKVKILESMKQKDSKINDLMNFVGVNTGVLLQKEQQQKIDPSNLLNKMINKGSEHDEWIQEIEQTIQDMKWDEEEEEKFQQNIRSLKKQQNNTTKLTNGQSVGFSNNIFRKMKEEQQVEDREHLMNKYQEGEHLNSQQMQFLANTSRLLNKCVDKVYEQQKANTLSKDLIHNIELKIAENIISQYYKIKNGLSILRNEYLQHKAKRDAIKLQKGKEQEIHQQILAQNREYYSKMTKVFRSYLNLRKKQNVNTIENLPYTSQVLVKAFSNKLKLKRAASIASNGSSRKINESSYLNNVSGDAVNKQALNSENKNLSTTLKNNFFNSKTPSPTKQQQQLNVFLDEEKKQQQKVKLFIPNVGIPKSKSLDSRIIASQYHAPSKLFAYEDHLKHQKGQKDDSDIRGYRRFYNSKKYDEKQSEQYDIKLLDNPIIKNKKQFISFYSKGPGKLIEEREKIQFLDVTRPNKQLLQSTKMIQRFIRGFLARLKVKRIKEKKLWDLQNKINQQSKHFMKKKQINQNNQTSSSTLQVTNSQKILIKRIDSKSNLKQNKPFFILDSHKRDSILENDDTISKNSMNLSQKLRINYLGDKSLSRSNLNCTPLKESTSSLQNTQQLRSHNPKIAESRKSISQSKLQRIKTDLLRQRLSSIIAEGEGERKKQLIKLNQDLKDLDKEGCESNVYKTLQSNSQSPSSSNERKSVSKIERKRMQQRRQALFRGVLNNDLNYLSLVGHRWEKIDFNQKDKHLNTPIYYACQKASIPMIKWLFSLGADVNTICSDGNTPLHLIFGLNNLDLLQYILKEEDRVDLNIRNKFGQTPLALCKQDILSQLGLLNGITIATNQSKRIHYDNNKLLQQNSNINVEDQLIQEQSYLIMKNFSIIDQKSNFNHIPSQRYMKKKSNLSIQSSTSQNFIKINKNI